MHKAIVSFISVLLLSGLCFSFGSGFCEGWKAGYVEGYCYNQTIGCISPIVPICPMPRMGEDNFESGYQRGFLAGLAAGR